MSTQRPNFGVLILAAIISGFWSTVSGMIALIGLTAWSWSVPAG